MKQLRKRIWIDSFQTGLLVRICLYLFVYQVATWAFFAVCELMNTISAGRGTEVSYLQNTLLRCLLVLLILGPPLTLDAIRFAHRLVGPLYRFRKAIQAIAAGESVEPIKLRNGDLLKEFQDDFNAMLRYLEQQGYVLLNAPERAVDDGAAQPAVSVAPSAIHTEV